MAAETALKEINLAAIPEILSRYNNFSRNDIISILQDMQNYYGYLHKDAMDELARLTNIPVSKFYSVATFYSQFHLEPHGKYTIRLCRGTACHVRGAGKIREAVMKQTGLDDGETSSDMKFSLETVACLGACALSPVMMINNTYYGKITPGRAQSIIKKLAEEKS